MKWIKPLLITIFLLLATAVHAQQECSVATVSVTFGLYDPLSSTPSDTQGKILISCSPGLAYQIILDPGKHSGGRFHPRKMRAGRGSEILAYNLYIDSSRTQVWGDGNDATFVGSGAGGRKDIHHVHGRILPLQNVPEGIYIDVVSVTILW